MSLPTPFPRSNVRACLSGLNPWTAWMSLRGLPGFFRHAREYSKANRRPTLAITLPDLYPILHEGRRAAGLGEGHYFHQDLWAAHKIFLRRPGRHIDVGSRIDGFVAHLLVFMPVTVVDIRPIPNAVSGMTFIRDDATTLSTLSDDTVESLSSLHAAEHFGLGRYSDRIDPEACFTFMRALARVLAPGGRLYFSVPIGRERVEFNAHRVFEAQTVLDAFRALHLLSFSFVGDDGRLYRNANVTDVPRSRYALGLFEFGKAR